MVRTTVTPHVEHAVLTVLAELPADRFASVAECADALANASFDSARNRVGADAGRRVNPRRRAITYATFGITIAAFSVLETRAFTPAPRADAASRRWSVVLPDSATLDFFAPSFTGEGQPALAVSPDGNRIAYVGRHNGTTLLFVREGDGTPVRALAGTDSATQPFFSLRGDWIGFFAGAAPHAPHRH